MLLHMHAFGKEESIVSSEFSKISSVIMLFIEQAEPTSIFWNEMHLGNKPVNHQILSFNPKKDLNIYFFPIANESVYTNWNFLSSLATHLLSFFSALLFSVVLNFIPARLLLQIGVLFWKAKVHDKYETAATIRGQKSHYAAGFSWNFKYNWTLYTWAYLFVATCQTCAFGLTSIHVYHFFSNHFSFFFGVGYIFSIIIH